MLRGCRHRKGLVLAVLAAVGVGALGAQANVERALQSHWAYQPIARPDLPVVKDTDWVRTSVDRFILARLEAQGMTPAPEADRQTLIRRVYFDLIGLPPSYEQVQTFIHDESPDALERVVDELLASPLYGQRWGRHWLDVARYADTMGYNFQADARYPFAWTYRDYVVDSFNADKPYDRFLMEQMAADFMDLDGRTQDLAALGFITVGRRFDFDIHSTIDDRIDVVTRGLMGLTVQCARCHDHKYEAVSIKDYYSLYGVFRSLEEPEVMELPIIQDTAELEGSAAYEQFRTELAKREQAIEDYYVQVHEGLRKEVVDRADDYLKAVLGTLPETVEVRNQITARFRNPWQEAGSPEAPDEQQLQQIAQAAAEGITLDDARRFINRAERNHLTQLRNQVLALYIESPGAPARAMVIYDSSKPFDPYVFERGQAGNRGPSVARRFLEVLQPFVGGEEFTEGSGRLEMARAIVHPDNPLTPRIIVNRIWQWHFGEGIVRTPSDFGVQGERPTHPQLLDHLARTFMDGGWSIKKLHRQIVLSAAYRQSSAERPDYALRDAENRLLGRFERRKLDFESMRDAMLHTAGRLDTQIGGRPAALVSPPYTTRRSVYGHIDRQYLDPALRTFDFADPDASAPDRPNTTVPQQALFLMNSQFLSDQVHHLFARPDMRAIHDDAQRVRRLYQILFSRDPTPDELELGLRYIGYEAQHHSEGQPSPWFKYAQALMISNEFMFID